HRAPPLPPLVRRRAHPPVARRRTPRLPVPAVTSPWAAFERSVFGTEGRGAIEARLCQAGEAVLGVAVERVAWVVASVAAVAGLAAQVRAGRDVDPTGLEEHPMAVTDDLYPTPHTTLFDFEKTAAGAEWIDEIAVVARQARDADADRAIVHADWSARNIRVID